MFTVVFSEKLLPRVNEEQPARKIYQNINRPMSLNSYTVLESRMQLDTELGCGVLDRKYPSINVFYLYFDFQEKHEFTEVRKSDWRATEKFSRANQ